MLLFLGIEFTFALSFIMFIIVVSHSASSSSLGKALSKELLCGGYNLVLVDRNETQLQNLKNDLERLIAHEPIEEAGIPCGRSRNMMVEQSCTPIEKSCSPIIKQRDIRLFCRDLSNPFTPFEVLRDLKRFNLLDKVRMVPSLHSPRIYDIFGRLTFLFVIHSKLLLENYKT